MITCKIIFVRFGVVQAATQPLQELYNYLEVEFHPLKLCSKVETTLKLIEGSEEMSVLQQYLPSLREITLVRLLQQVAQVYQSIGFNRLLGLASFTDAFTLERIIVGMFIQCSKKPREIMLLPFFEIWRIPDWLWMIS